MEGSWILTLLLVGFVHSKFQEGPEIKISVGGVHRKSEKNTAGILVKPNQTVVLNCSFVCMDDNLSKCSPIKWEKRHRNGSSASRAEEVPSKSNHRRGLDSYWRVHSAVTLISSFSQHVLYTCTTKHGFQSTAFIDVIEVQASDNITIPTKVINESVGKVTYPKYVVNSSEPLQLRCEFTTTAPDVIRTATWKHDGKLLQEGDEYEMKRVSEDKLHVIILIIKKPNPNSLGIYQCALSISPGRTTQKIINVFGPPITILGKEHSIRVPEDSSTSLTCSYRAHPSDDVKVEWFRKNYSLPLTLGVGVKVEDEIDKDGNVVAKSNVLKFETIKAGDKGVYFCKVTSPLGADYLGWQIRVKNRLAFLWPLVGIILEVIVVVVVIVVYEVKNNKRKKAKALAQQNQQYTDEDCQAAAADYDADSEVRQRLARA